MKTNTIIIVDDDIESNEYCTQMEISKKQRSSIKRKSAWISSSFDDFGSAWNSQQETVKKGVNCERKNKLQNDFTSKIKKPEEFIPWVEKYKPTTEAELAVHKKKVTEIRDWLCKSLSQKEGGILILTGPSGCGKTAALKCLSLELGVEIQEWVNPEVQSQSEFQANKGFELMWTDSQTKQFQDFLFRANRYSGIAGISAVDSAPVSNLKRIICIEDLPSFAFKDAPKLQDMLRQYKRVSRNPLVFIMSDSFSGSSNVHSLFPRHILAELKITKISLNPVATTILLKTMSRISSQECRLHPKETKNPTKNDLDLLASSCNGDIRSAINALQFSCTKGVSFNTESKKSTVSQKRTHQFCSGSRSKTSKSSGDEKLVRSSIEQNDPTLAIGSRDSSLFLFRALGKILYCKREAGTSKEEAFQLPHHLHGYARDRLLVDTDDVVEKTRISGETVNLYLHQNYLDFYNNIDDVALASDYCSDADSMAGPWQSREIMCPYFTVIVPRAVAFHNHRKLASSGSAWKPLHKPQWYETSKEMISHCEAVKHLFTGFRYSSYHLQTEVLPYLAKINPPLNTPSQISLLQTITSFRLGKMASRHRSEQLADSDFSGLEQTGMDVAGGSTHFRRTDSSCSLVTSDISKAVDEEDDIEEFDD